MDRRDLNPDSQYMERLDELFTAAVDLPPEGRAALLMRETARDPEVGRRLQKLLDYDRLAAGNILSVLRDITSADAVLEGWAGRHFGPYRIIREVGRGGMGVVFEAVRDDLEYHKTVALKIATGWSHPDTLRERFRQERQILAALEHPYIARLLDGGTHGGIPYFAMEFVEGCPITDYAEQCGLKLESRIELVRKVCAALEHAHQNLVVHRDLKPSNILVTADGTPKLLDFGIAKLLSPGANNEDSRGGLTSAGAAPWTPDYASPEQVRCQAITTKADIYSLGLILYELLTGEKAQKADVSSPAAMEQSICEATPPRPSSRTTGDLSRRLCGDLDTVVGQATHKDPARRYSSMAELNEDLGRYLQNRPLRARRDNQAYRIRKFVRRNWLPVAAAAAVVLSLAAGLVAFAWQARVADANRRSAELARDRESRQHDIADQQRDSALREKKNAEDMAHEALLQRNRGDKRTAELSDLAQHAVFELYSSVETLSGSLDARQKMLRTTLDYLEKLRPEKGTDPEFMRSLGQAYMDMGNIQGSTEIPSLGNLTEALKNYRTALQILQPLPASNPSASQFELSLADALYRVGSALRYSGKYREGREYLEKSLAAAKRAQRLAPNDAGAAKRMGVAATGISVFLTIEDDPNAAEPYAREAVSIFQRLLAKDPKNDEYLDGIAATYNSMSSIATLRHDVQGTFEFVRKSNEIRETQALLKPADAAAQRNLMISYGNMGDALGGAVQPENLGDPQAAIVYYKKCIAIAEQMLLKDPNSKAAANDRAMARLRAGLTMAWPEGRAESTELLRQASSAFAAALAGGPANSSLRKSATSSYTALASRLLADSKLDEGLVAVQRAVDASTAPEVASETWFRRRSALSLMLRAVISAKKGARDGAMVDSQRAAKLLTGTTASEFVLLPLYWTGLGDVYEALAMLPSASASQRRADWEQAKTAYRRSAALWRETRATQREKEAAELEARIADGDALLESFVLKSPLAQ